MSAYTSEPANGNERRQTLVALGFLVLAVILAYLPPSQQELLAAGVRSTALRPFLATQALVIRARQRTVEVELLRAQMDSLVSVLAASTRLEEENRRLRDLLELHARVGPRYRPATVVRPGTSGSASVFLLDAGAAEGVRVGAPVLVRDGLVGVVREVGRHESIGMDWTHPDFRASAMTADGSTYGIVEARRGEFREEDRLVLDGTEFHTRLDTGTLVVTSGRGGVYPRGIPLGAVVGVADAETGWKRSYFLDAAVEPGSVTHVLVGVQGERSDSGDVTSAFPPDSVLMRLSPLGWRRALEQLRDTAPPEADGSPADTSASGAGQSTEAPGRGPADAPPGPTGSGDASPPPDTTGSAGPPPPSGAAAASSGTSREEAASAGGAALDRPPVRPGVGA